MSLHPTLPPSSPQRALRAMRLGTKTFQLNEVWRLAGVVKVHEVVEGSLDRFLQPRDGTTVHTSGDRHGTEGYFINPTIFTDIKPNMEIMKEIFGPMGVLRMQRVCNIASSLSSSFSYL